MVKITILFFACVLFLYSCSEKNERPVVFEITPKAYTLSLPDSSGLTIAGFAADLDRNEYLRTIPSPPQRIERYSLEDGALKEVIHTQTSTISGVLHYNDGFLVFDNHTHHLMHLDGTGQVIGSYAELEDSPVPGLAPVYANWANAPMMRHGDSVFFGAALASGIAFDHNHPDFLNLGVVRVFDLQQKHFSWLGQVSPGNRIEDYGNGHRYTATFAKDQLVISPGFSTELMRVTIPDGNTSVVTYRKWELDELLTPYRLWKDMEGSDYIASVEDAHAMIEHYRITPSFVNILYDQFRDLFYRLLIIPRTDERQGEMKILVYDGDLNYLGDYNLPNHYTTWGAFVSNKGLNLINRQDYKENSSKLVFDAFVIFDSDD